MNQVLFRVGESMELLSNQVLDSFPSRIDGEINGFAWGLKVNNGWRGRESSCSVLSVLKQERRGREPLGRKGKDIYIYP